MRVQNIMTKHVTTYRANDALTAAARAMGDNDCGAIPVPAEAGRLTGIMTEVARDVDPQDRTDQCPQFNLNGTNVMNIANRLLYMLMFAAFIPLHALEGTYTIEIASSTGLAVAMNKYLPPGYDNPTNADKRYPLLIWLSGSGETGDPNDPVDMLDESTTWGPSHEIRFSDRDYPCIVVTPICEDIWSKRIHDLNVMIEFLKEHDRVDPDQIHIVGASAGGAGLLEYAQVYHDQIASAVVVTAISEPRRPDRLVEIPTWILHSFNERPFPRQWSITWANAIANASVATPDCMDTYPYGPDQSGNVHDVTGTFRPDSGWTWLRGINAPSDAVLHFTLKFGGLHNIWQATINDPTVLHWIFKQRRQSPFHGTPAVLPGRVQAEDFDFGGMGRAYFDRSAGNAGLNGHRMVPNPFDGIGDDEEVDVASGGSGVVLTGTEGGEWLEFTTAVTESGFYTLQLQVSAAQAGGSLEVTANGVAIAPSIAIPATTGFTTITVPVVLNSGPHVLRLIIVQGGFDLDWFALIPFADPRGLLITPTSGPTTGGTIVTIDGDHLADATVRFGGTSGTVLSATFNQVVVVTPAHAAGTVDVVVTTSSVSTFISGTFTFIAPLPPPIIAAIIPSSGPVTGGLTVTIDGTHLDGATVTFDGVPATVISTTSTQVTAITPAHDVGAVDVVVTTEIGSTSAQDAFSYTTTSGSGGGGSSSSAGGGSGGCGLGSGITLLMLILSLLKMRSLS